MFFKPISGHIEKEYIVARETVSGKLYLFRCIPDTELHWYVSPDDPAFFSELKAVLLYEVDGLEQAEKDVRRFCRAKNLIGG
ncbi:hypothetical protein Ami103574_10970 [Aminipila butyrica]|uniref:Uncharacterized protein n=1 Tax=Aminipila butyrica TaxID=433296 RepID=A0A858BY22_9FIRM|nr:hypothetical protein [Aminipila butyrica]QIB69810.1 hypothetical protein Ami103574_10970 [Aminipila butyrica]